MSYPTAVSVSRSVKAGGVTHVWYWIVALGCGFAGSGFEVDWRTVPLRGVRSIFALSVMVKGRL